MATELSPETKGQLQRYLDGNLSNAELAEWLAAAEYDLELPQDERDALAQISLVLVEVEEKRRGTPEILGAVAVVLASATSRETVISPPRSDSTTSWQGEQRITAMPAPLQTVSI